MIIYRVDLLNDQIRNKTNCQADLCWINGNKYIDERLSSTDLGKELWDLPWYHIFQITLGIIILSAFAGSFSS
jgi:hypothetical protein